MRACTCPLAHPSPCSPHGDYFARMPPRCSSAEADDESSRPPCCWWACCGKHLDGRMYFLGGFLRELAEDSLEMSSCPCVCTEGSFYSNDFTWRWVNARTIIYVRILDYYELRVTGYYWLSQGLASYFTEMFPVNLCCKKCIIMGRPGPNRVQDRIKHDEYFQFICNFSVLKIVDKKGSLTLISLVCYIFYVKKYTRG